MRRKSTCARRKKSWTHWDVREFKGRVARIVIVDDRTGHFGHINADCFYFDDSPRK